MRERKRIFYLILIMIVITLIVASITIYLLYRASFKEQQDRLIETAQSQARLIEAMARFNAIYSIDYVGGSEVATLMQIIDAHQNYKGFGETGELTLARREGDDIVFLLSHRHYDLSQPIPVPFNSNLAEAMRQALLGRSGIHIGLDYRGEKVLAAYEQVVGLNLGIVVKIDMKEIRKPFVKAGIAAISTALLCVIVGTILFLRISNPIIRRLEQYSQHLEEMVEKRTEELRAVQEELIRKEKLAVLGKLAGGVGHELRNPLGVIANAVYFLNMILADADEKIKEYLEIISSEVSNSDKIVSDLLNLSRTKPAQKEEVFVSEITSQLLQRKPPPGNISVNIEIDDELPAMFIDKQQIGQVLTNLLVNAYQAMPEGGKLNIKAGIQDEKIIMSFTDTGCGISKENLRNIWEPLFTTKARGIGLGLAVSKSLVEVNNGTIKVDSKEGKGTTFEVTLPTVEMEE